MAKAVEGGRGWTRIGNEKRTGSRNWRNNNPGNIEYGPFARQMGAIGTDGRFAVFPDYETGRRAKSGLLFSGKNYKDKSIFGAISKYAPSFENDTMAYAKSVARALGVSIHTKLSDLTSQQREVMMDAMQKVEGFKKGVTTQLTGFPEPPQARNAQLAQFPDAPLPPSQIPSLAYTSPTTQGALAYSPESPAASSSAIDAIGALAPMGSLAALDQPTGTTFRNFDTSDTVNGYAPPSQASVIGQEIAAAPSRFNAPTVTPTVSQPYSGPPTAETTNLATHMGITGFEVPTSIPAIDAKAMMGQGILMPTQQPSSPMAPMGYPDIAMQMQAPGIGPMPAAGEIGALGIQIDPTTGMTIAPAQPPASPPISPLSPVYRPAHVTQQVDPMKTAAAIPSSLSVGDVYGGQVGTAAADNGNFVSRDNYDTTSVTNQAGATTGMRNGYQTAYGGRPGPMGSMPSIFGGKPFGGKFSLPGPNRTSNVMSTLAGGALGTLAGGPLGGLIGALAGRYVAGPMIGNALSGGFPDAPSRRNDSVGVAGGARTRAERSSLSPAASRSIDRGDAVSGLW